MLRQFLVGGGVSICNIAAAAQSLTSTAPDSSPGKIDKSQLALAESKLRDKAHLKFVASQPCRSVVGNRAILIICGLLNRELLALKSAMSSQCHSAGAITGSFIKPAMKLCGGTLSKSMRWKPPSTFANKPIHRPSVPEDDGSQTCSRCLPDVRVYPNVVSPPRAVSTLLPKSSCFGYKSPPLPGQDGDHDDYRNYDP